MRDTNTMGDLEYVWENLFWSIIGLIMYRNLFFYPVLGMSDKMALAFLAGVVAVCVWVGVAMTWRWRRNNVSLVTNIVCAFGIYFVISFWKICRQVLLWAAAVAVVAIVGYVCIVCLNFSRERKTGRTFSSWGRCICACLLNSRTIAAVVLAVLLAGAAFGPLLGLPIMELQSDAVAVDGSALSQEGQTIAGNIDTILLLQEDRWSQLDASERLRVMKTVADIESNYLGFPVVDVGTKVLDEGTLGTYNDSKRTILLDLGHLASDDAKSVLDTVCHECRHAYQNQLVKVYRGLDAQSRELLIFNTVARFEQEFADYIDGDEDMEGYYAQWCERDSREYAAEAVEDYYRRIEGYLAETAAQQVG